MTFSRAANSAGSLPPYGVRGIGSERVAIPLPVRAIFSAKDRVRFWSKVELRGPEECWLWTDGKSLKGYGSMNMGGKTSQAHRVVWMLTHGSIPTGLLVCHRCDNPPCCNPRHLFVGSSADNTHDMVAKGRLYTPRGEENGLAKLTAAKVREARALHAAGVGLSELARRLGVDRSNISRAVNRKSWRHV